MKFSFTYFNFFLTLVFFVLSVSSCKSHSTGIKSQSVTIPGRQNPKLYEVEVPKSWIIQQSHSNGYEQDTTLPLIEFFINDADDQIRITIHNFPNQKLEKRIPPMQQVERWKKQFSPLTFYTLLNQSFAGFVGVLLEGEGWMQNKKISMLAWSMQLDQTLYQHLDKILTYQESMLLREIQSDITIKAVGPKSLIDKYKKEIIQMALSFKLIDEIPYSP